MVIYLRAIGKEVKQIDKYDKLTQDLVKAKETGIEAGKGDDGGTANLDSVFLTLPYWRENKVIQAIKNAGLFCSGKIKWIGYGYLISPVGCGQGNSRARAMEAMRKVLRDDGYDVLGFYRMD